MKATQLRFGPLGIFFLEFILVLSLAACNSTIEPDKTSTASTGGIPSETPGPPPSVTNTPMPEPISTATVIKTIAPSISSTLPREITPPKSLPAAGNLIFVHTARKSGLEPDGIYMIRFPDLKPVVIVPREDHTGLQVHPSVSPDGKWIVFSSNESTNDTGSYDLYIIGSDGKGRRRLTYGGYSTSPSWSPDGKWIAYSALDNIFYIRPDGSGAEGLTSGPGHKNMPVWSPDGHFLAFINHTGYDSIKKSLKYTLQVLEMQTRHLYTLVEWVRENQFFDNYAWSLDSKKIYFTKAEDCDTLFVIENKEGAVPLPVNFPTGHLMGISWSPDGKWMSYIIAKDSKNCLSAGSRMYVAPVDGSYAVEILDSSGFDPVQPAWAP